MQRTDWQIAHIWAQSKGATMGDKGEDWGAFVRQKRTKQTKIKAKKREKIRTTPYVNGLKLKLAAINSTSVGWFRKFQNDLKSIIQFLTVISFLAKNADAESFETSFQDRYSHEGSRFEETPCKSWCQIQKLLSPDEAWDNPRTKRSPGHVRCYFSVPWLESYCHNNAAKSPSAYWCWQGRLERRQAECCGESEEAWRQSKARVWWRGAWPLAARWSQQLENCDTSLTNPWYDFLRQWETLLRCYALLDRP